MVPDIAGAVANHHSTRSSNAAKPGHHQHRIFFKVAVLEDKDHRFFQEKIPLLKAMADDDKADPILQEDTIAPTISAATMSNLRGGTTAVAATTTSTTTRVAIRTPTRTAIAMTSYLRVAEAAAPATRTTHTPTRDATTTSKPRCGTTAVASAAIGTPRSATAAAAAALTTDILKVNKDTGPKYLHMARLHCIMRKVTDVVLHRTRRPKQPPHRLYLRLNSKWLHQLPLAAIFILWNYSGEMASGLIWLPPCASAMNVAYWD